MSDKPCTQSNIQARRISEVHIALYVSLINRVSIRRAHVDVYPRTFRWISCKEINPKTIVRAKEDAIEIVCLLEEHFLTSILNIQVHLLVYLVDEVEIASTMHA